MSCQPCGKPQSSQGVPYVTGTQGGITTSGQTSENSKIPWWLIIIIILGAILLGGE